MEEAVIQTGGKQYKVKEGEVLKVEKITPLEKSLEFKDLLSNRKVVASIQGEVKGKKIRILKYKPKKHYKKVLGHRQTYSLLKIEKIA